MYPYLNIILCFLCILITQKSFSQTYELLPLDSINTENDDFRPKIIDDSTLLFIREIPVPFKTRVYNMWQMCRKTTLYQYNYIKGQAPNPLIEIHDILFRDYIFDDTLQWLLVERCVFKEGESCTILYRIKSYQELEKGSIKNAKDKKPYPIFSENIKSCFQLGDTMYYADNFEYDTIVDGTQIYFINVNKQTLFDEEGLITDFPRPLKEVNSLCDEAYFFIDENGQYFFSRRCNDEDWNMYQYNPQTKETIKLPYPFNTAWDDYGYVSKGNRIFFTSNRFGGEGGLDIYGVLKQE